MDQLGSHVRACCRLMGKGTYSQGLVSEDLKAIAFDWDAAAGPADLIGCTAFQPVVEGRFTASD